MNNGIAYTGIPSAEELAACKGLPSEARMAKGAVACVECLQCIPCNPCETACPVGAISLGGVMTNVPVLDEEKCIGCGQCIAKCPGLAITVINKAYGEGLASLDFPFEYLPLPKADDTVQAVDRAGQVVCDAKVISVSKAEGTTVVRIAFPLSYAGTVKSIKRLSKEA